MKLFLILSIILLGTLFVSSNSINAQKYPSACPKSAPDFNKCLQANFHLIKPLLLKGIPELHLPGLDPLDIKMYTHNLTLNDDIQVITKFYNIHVTGIKDTRLENLNFNPNTLEGEFTVIIPSLKTKLQYEAKAHIFGKLMQTSGSVRCQRTNNGVDVKLKLKPVYKYGVEYYTFDKLDIDVIYGDMDINVIADNPETQDMINRFIDYYKQNRQGIISLLRPMIKLKAEELARRLLEPMLSLIPAKYLLPE